MRHRIATYIAKYVGKGGHEELWSKVVFGVRQGFEGGGGLAENVACLE